MVWLYLFLSFVVFCLFRLAGNVLQLAEVADLEALTFNLALIFIRKPNVQFSTEPAILPYCCCAKIFLE
jgi:hypothetical protein